VVGAAAAAAVMAVAVDARAIVNGAPDDTAHPFVGAIQPMSPSCGPSPSDVECTGTLVGPRLVLTAAHCLGGNVDAAQVMGVTFASDATSATAQWLRVVDARIDPAWTDGDGSDDAALLLLEADAPATPATLALGTAATAGEMVTIVGFGADASGNVGKRLTGAAVVSTVSAGDFGLTASPAMTCNGDSGGPAFAGGDAGAQLVGITAYGDEACTTGTDVRVDAVASFLSPAMTALAQPTAARPPIDPSLDTCSATCASHADCPIGMACTPRGDGTSGCAVAGLASGRFGASCSADDGAVPCVQAGSTCLLWEPCASASSSSATPGSAKATGGCSVTRGTGGRGDGAAFAVLLAACVALRRASRRSR
jgi:V8-like Glu-specific endopeptidase